MRQYICVGEIKKIKSEQLADMRTRSMKNKVPVEAYEVRMALLSGKSSEFTGERREMLYFPRGYTAWMEVERSLLKVVTGVTSPQHAARKFSEKIQSPGRSEMVDVSESMVRTVLCNHHECDRRWAVHLDNWPSSKAMSPTVSIRGSTTGGWIYSLERKNGWLKLTFYCSDHASHAKSPV